MAGRKPIDSTKPNGVFITVGGLGRLDEKGRLSCSMGFKRFVVCEDRQLLLVRFIAELVNDYLRGYTSLEAAKNDLARFKAWAAGLEIKE